MLKANYPRAKDEEIRAWDEAHGFGAALANSLRAHEQNSLSSIGMVGALRAQGLGAQNAAALLDVPSLAGRSAELWKGLANGPIAHTPIVDLVDDELPSPDVSEVERAQSGIVAAEPWWLRLARRLVAA